jgi:hypothetical protein
MASTSLPASAKEATTRVQRGRDLYAEHGDKITHEGRGVYTVPGCAGGAYRVDLAVFGGAESCSCPDHRHHREYSCKHLIAATIHRAKTTARRRRESEARRARRKQNQPMELTGGEKLTMDQIKNIGAHAVMDDGGAAAELARLVAN